MHILHSIISFQNHKDNEQDDKQGTYITTIILMIVHITHPKVYYAGHLGDNKWREV
jgi:hypothetical protein